MKKNEITVTIEVQQTFCISDEYVFDVDSNKTNEVINRIKTDGVDALFNTLEQYDSYHAEIGEIYMYEDEYMIPTGNYRSDDTVIANITIGDEYV